MARANSLSGLLGFLPIAGKSGSDDGIAGRDVKEKQRMHESEENEGNWGEGFHSVLTKAPAPLGKGCRGPSSDRFHLGTGD